MDSFDIGKLKTGDTKEFEKFYEQVFVLVKKYILSNNGTVQDAEDVFQDAFLVLMTYILKEEFELRVELKTFFFAIVKYKWLSNLKKQNKTISAWNQIVEIQEEVLLHDIVDREMLLLKMESNMALLKEDCQKILIYYYFDNLNMNAISKLMNFTEDFARLKKHRCLTYLKELIRKSID